MRRSFLGIGIVALASVSGCSVTPPLSDATGASDNGVFVGDVVNRIKCELMIAFDDKLRDDPNHLYMWLRDWTVKVDLTLQANEQGGISPSGSYTAIRRSAVNQAAGPTASPGTTLGTVAQFFTFAANANLGEQAVRTETVSFTLALKELEDLQRRTPASRFEQLCRPNDKAELLGNLGLKEWIDASLAPVVAHKLLAGKHPAPQSGAKPLQPPIVGKPSSLPSSSGIASFATTFTATPVTNAADFDKAVKQASQAAQGAINDYRTLASAWKRIQDAFDKIKAYQTAYDNISTQESIASLKKQRDDFDKDWENAKNARNCAVQQICGPDYGDCTAFNGAAGHRADVCMLTTPVTTCGPHDDASALAGTQAELGCALYAQEQEQKNSSTSKWLPLAQDAARRADVYASNVKTLSDYVGKLTGNVSPLPPDPPIDSIGHSVQFVLAYGAGLTPSWTLIAWKGPAMNAPGAAASVNRTHLLQMALGPSVDTGKSTAEQGRILQNQTIFLSRP